MKKIVTALTVLLAIFAVSCGKDKKESVTDITVIPVKVSETTAGNNTRYVISSGKIEAENSATVSTRIMGYITKVYVKTGQKVSEGQLLLSINNTDLQAKKAQADAAVLQAAAAFNNARKDYDRFVTLFGQQSASQKELDDMAARYEMAKAALEGVKQMRNEVRAQFSYTSITSPFSGEVSNTFVKEGDMANPGMPLLSVEGPSRLQVAAMVSESDITSIKNGMDAKVLVKSTGEVLNGTVTEVSLSSRNTGAQYLVKINLAKTNDKVLSGMFVNVQFPIADQQETTVSATVLVPESALVKQGQLTGIYTIGSGNVAILRWLRTGRSFGDQVEVLSGLGAREQYIVSAEGKLFNGAKISIQ